MKENKHTKIIPKVIAAVVDYFPLISKQNLFQMKLILKYFVIKILRDKSKDLFMISNELMKFEEEYMKWQRKRLYIL